MPQPARLPGRAAGRRAPTPPAGQRPFAGLVDRNATVRGRVPPPPPPEPTQVRRPPPRAEIAAAANTAGNNSRRSRRPATITTGRRPASCTRQPPRDAMPATAAPPRVRSASTAVDNRPPGRRPTRPRRMRRADRRDRVEAPVGAAPPPPTAAAGRGTSKPTPITADAPRPPEPDRAACDCGRCDCGEHSTLRPPGPGDQGKPSAATPGARRRQTRQPPKRAPGRLTVTTGFQAGRRRADAGRSRPLSLAAVAATAKARPPKTPQGRDSQDAATDASAKSPTNRARRMATTPNHATGHRQPAAPATARRQARETPTHRSGRRHAATPAAPSHACTHR